MPRHAGYSVALTIPEEIANRVISSYFYFGKEDFNYFFTPPSPITLGPIQVALSGLFRVLQPRVEFHTNNEQRADVFFSLTGKISVEWTGFSRVTWELQLDTQISASIASQADGIDVPREDRKVRLVIDLSNVEVEQLSVTRLSGPPILQPLLDAINSFQFRSSLNDFLRGLELLPVSMPLLNSFFYQQVRGFREFSWFDVCFGVTNTGIKVVDQGVTLGLDFTGIDYSTNQLNNAPYTTGNAGLLEKLSTGSVSAYKTTISVSSLPTDRPALFDIGVNRADNIAIVINNAFISALVADQVSPDIAGTHLDEDDRVILQSVSFSTTIFDNERTGQRNQQGARIDFSTEVMQEHHVTGYMVLQPYLQTFSNDFGGTYNLKKEYWRIAITKTEVDFPWYIDVGIVVLNILAIPVIASFLPFLIFKIFGRPSLFTVLGDLSVEGAELLGKVTDIYNNAANLAYLNATGIVGAFPEPWRNPLPELDKPNWEGNIQWVAFTEESLEIGVRTYPDWSEIADDKPLAVITPTATSAEYIGPIPIQLKLREDIHKMSLHNSLFVDWQIRRGDNGNIVYSTRSPYTNSMGSRIFFLRHTEDSYFADSFIIRASVTITLNGNTGEVWTGEQALQVEDILNRNFQFVKWGPHIAHFHKPGSTTEWWSHVRRSRIHRTAVAARCMVLKENAERQFYSGYTSFTHFNNPVLWDNLELHRHALCEYCFFGGPDKTVPFPKEDWFFPQAIGRVLRHV